MNRATHAFLGNCHSPSSNQKLYLATPETIGGPYRLGVCEWGANGSRTTTLNVHHYYTFATHAQMLRRYHNIPARQLRQSRRVPAYQQPDGSMLIQDIYAGAHLRFTHQPSGQWFVATFPNFKAALAKLLNPASARAA